MMFHQFHWHHGIKRIRWHWRSPRRHHLLGQFEKGITNNHLLNSNRNYSTKNSYKSNPLSQTLTTIWPLPIINHFKSGLSRLVADFRDSLHIQEAKLTQLHLQRRMRRDDERRRKRLRSHEAHGIKIVDPSGRRLAFIPSESRARPKRKGGDDAPVGRPPSSGDYLSTRRPQEHLRQMSRDLQTTLPTVAAFVIVPGVGYSFLLLGMMFPRLLLSRQFHTREQRWEFATKEYGERIAWYKRLNGDFWGCCMMNMPGLGLCQDEDECGDRETRNFEERNNNFPRFLKPMSYLRTDAAGPVFSENSMLRLYHLFQQIESPSIKKLQSTHLHSLALSNNLAAPLYLPSSVAPIFLQTCLPSINLQRKLTTLAEDIIMDDAAMIEEGQLEAECGGMTEEEILDACWLRGLPLGRFVKANTADRGSCLGGGNEALLMRKVLANHLQMVKIVMMNHHLLAASPKEIVENDWLPKGDLVRDTTLQLLILHLPAIRYSMMLNSNNNVKEDS